jgi:enamine deaminase RidA (YjgF/YER057c/UK114 family)
VAIERGNVHGLSEPPGYTHYAAVTDHRLVFLAGQVPLDAEGNLVGDGDPRAQTHQCLDNLKKVLAHVGAEPEHAVRTTVYVVASGSGNIGNVWEAILDSDISAVARTAATLVGVERLGYHRQLVEIEVTLAIPHPENTRSEGS